MKCPDPCRPQAEVSLQSKFNMQITSARGRHTPTHRSFCATVPPVAFFRSSASSWHMCHRRQIFFHFHWMKRFVDLDSVGFRPKQSLSIFQAHNPHLLVSWGFARSDCGSAVVSCPAPHWVNWCCALLTPAFKVLFSWRSWLILLRASSSVCANAVMYWCQCNIAGSTMAQTRPWGRPLDLPFFSLFYFL